MSTRVAACVAVAVVAVAAVALTARQQPPAASPVAPIATQPPAPDANAREADREAIVKSSREFAAAFNTGDAKAVAAQWTENGECHEAGGGILRGRAAIEKGFADFFKANPQARIEVLVEAVRFPAADLAIEEGILRQTRSPKDLPGSTLYRVTHVREAGKWRPAVSDEIAAGIDRLEDLDWLLGEWKGTVGDQQMTLTLTRDAKKPFVLGKFARTEGRTETVAGTFRIGFDPQAGRLRSWHFDDDGGHGQALWVRDGNRWVLDSTGVLGDGTPTASVNVLGRVDADTITWRSIDRTLGGRPMPDTVPVRLTRAPAK